MRSGAHGWVGQDILKGVYLTLWFWHPEIVGKFQMSVKNKAAVNAPWVCSIQPLLYLGFHYDHSVFLIQSDAKGCHIYISAWGSALLVSTDRAIPTSLRVWSERQCRASRLNRNMIYTSLIFSNTITGTLWIDTIKFPLFLFSQEAYFYSNMSILCR